MTAVFLGGTDTGVMTPPAKAGGFSGNGTGNPHRWRLKAPSEPLSLEQHVPCGVVISTETAFTRRTLMPPLAQRLRDRLTATRIALRGASWVHCHQGPSSFLRFDEQDEQELAPASVVHRPGQHAAGQPCNVQV